MKRKVLVISIALMLFLTNAMFFSNVLAKGEEDSIWWRIQGEEDSIWWRSQGEEDSIWWRSQ